MSICFSVSPDFSPRQAAGWFYFNTWLQRTLGTPLHLELFASFAELRRAIRRDRADLIYANPFDAASLIRERGFRAAAAPRGLADEALIAVKADSPVQSLRELRPGIRISSTDSVDVHTMGMLLLEPADLGANNVQVQIRDSYVLVAKDLLRRQADAGFFLEAAYQELSSLVRNGLRPIAQSRIQVVRHSLLTGPEMADRHDELVASLSAMDREPRGRAVLASLGFQGWDRLEQEDIEFMIDLMDTLSERMEEPMAAAR